MDVEIWLANDARPEAFLRGVLRGEVGGCMRVVLLFLIGAMAVTAASTAVLTTYTGQWFLSVWNIALALVNLVMFVLVSRT